MSVPPVVLTIAGFDPSSGAGVTADIKTIAAHGCYGIACITALTVQSSTGVKQVEPVAAGLVRDTLQDLAADFPAAAIHVGMLGSGAVAEAVANFLEGIAQRGPRPEIVLDPILRSSSGADLLDAAGREVLRCRLLSLATVVTPNLHEAAVLSGAEVGSLLQMREAAARMHRLGAKAVVVKGGHLQGKESVDLLSVAREESGLANLPLAVSPLGASPSASVITSPEQFEFRSPRLNSTSTHGTGCAFASALACNLAMGRTLFDAVSAAKQYVATAIGRAFPLGHGEIRPMHHLFRLDGQ